MRTLMIQSLVLLLFLLPRMGMTVEVTVVTTTDFHGGFLPKNVKTKTGEVLDLGGAAMLSSYINRIRSLSNGPVILLDVGDAFKGSIESNNFEGAPVIDLFNHLEYDALTIGNQEFEFGPSGQKRVASPGGEEDSLGAIKDRIAQAHFPFLAINITDKNGNLFDGLKPSTVIERGGVRVGVIGAISLSAREEILSPKVKELSFTDPIPLIIKEAQRLRTESNVDFVVLSYHTGLECADCDLNSDDSDSSICSQDNFSTLMDELPKGLIDLIVGGDNHKLLAKNNKGIGLLKAGHRGRGLAWAKLSKGKVPELHTTEICNLSFMDKTTQRWTCNEPLVKAYEGKLQKHRFLGEVITADPVVAKMTEGFLEKIERIKNNKSSVYLEDKFTASKTDESPVGNWFTDTLGKALDAAGVRADLIMQNNSGLRSPIGPGFVIFRDIFSILPFDDNLVTISLTGVQLKRLVSLAIQIPEGEGYSYSNFTFKVNDQCKVTEMKVGGVDVQVDKSYILATNDYLGYGGDNFDKKIGFSQEDIHIYYDQPLLRELVFNYLDSKEEEQISTDFYSPSRRRQEFPLHCRKSDPSK